AILGNSGRFAVVAPPLITALLSVSSVPKEASASTIGHPRAIRSVGDCGIEEPIFLPLPRPSRCRLYSGIGHEALCSTDTLPHESGGAFSRARLHHRKFPRSREVSSIGGARTWIRSVS